MRKSLILSSLVAVFVAGGALAANLSDSGTIKSIDSTKHQVTLSDGKTFVVPASMKLNNYKVGEKVRVTYQTKNGQMAATDIRAM
jgi:Cu/Ag efflux protein CusF